MTDSDSKSQGGPNYTALRAMGIPLRQSAPLGGAPAEESDQAPSQATEGSGEKEEASSEPASGVAEAVESAEPQSGVNYEALRKQGIFLKQSARPRAGPPTPGGRPQPIRLPIFDYLEGKRVILASASPRRKALLAQVRRVPPR